MRMNEVVVQFLLKKKEEEEEEKPQTWELWSVKIRRR